MNDKEFLIRVRADIQQALSEYKRLADETRKLEKETAGREKRQGDTAAGAIRDLDRKIELLGKESELERALWETQKGRYKDLTAAQKQEILDRARRLDQAKQEQAGVATLQAGYTRLIGRIAGLVTAYVSLTAAARQFGEAVQLAARVETLQVVLETVGRNAGYGSEQLRALVKDVEALGITTRAAQTILTRMAQAQLDLGQATELARVAQDAAVIGQVNSSEALERLLHGIVTLQPEILRTIGITVTFEQEYAKFAAATGRTIDSLSQQEKQQIALNAVLREGQKIQGTYVEAMGTADKQAGSLSRHTEQLQVAIGKAFQPAYVFLIQEMTRALIEAREAVEALNEQGTLETWANRVVTAFATVSTAGDIIARNIRIQTGGVIALLQAQWEALKGNFSEARKILSDFKKEAAEIINAPTPLDRLNEARRSAFVSVGGQASRLIFANEEDKQRFLEDQQFVKDALADINRAAKSSGEGRVEQDKKLRDLYAETIEGLDRQIALLGSESALEEALWETQNGRYRDLTAAQKQEIINRAMALDLFREELEASRQLAEEEKKRKDEGRRIFEETRTPEERLAAAEVRLRELLDRGAFGDPNSDEALDTYMRARLQVAERYYEELAKTSEKTLSEMDRFAIKAAEGMQQAFADEFFDVMQGNFDGLGESFTRLLQRMAAELAASELLEFLTGDFGKTGKVGGAFGDLGAWFASLFHDGGVAGRGTSSRAVSPLAFLGAPRLHAGALGLKSDEFPAILQDGESVLTAEQMKALGRGGGNAEVRVVMENRGTPKEASAASASFDPEGMVVRIVLDDVQRGGPISSGLGRAFNLKRGGS